MKCVEVYKELYHQEPFDVAFCPYRISLEKSTVWQSTKEFTWPTIRSRTVLWSCSR